MSVSTLVTCALPYANGPIHLGHMVEHIQTDVYVRALRSAGESVAFLCADDTHGTPIELRAQAEGVAPEVVIERWSKEHQRDFKDFDISFDAYGSTNSPDNKRFAELIYGRLKEAGSIERREIEQAYDDKAQRFLPDRFIRGTCPNCNSADQYGDACEKCGATYTPRELKDARSAVSGAPLVWRTSAHLFFKLSAHEAFLKSVLADPKFLNPALSSQLQQFFQKGLADWDISRDGPYFGFEIPGEKNKYFYVWLDAPIGYIAATELWARNSKSPRDALALWDAASPTRIRHFIGKDIVYFHCLFWPTVLKVAGLRQPETVHVHGMLTVNGEKMSKSRGTFINARPYLDALDPSYLRFFFASLLGPGAEDIDLNLGEFKSRVNAELVNNLGNFANRSLSLLGNPALARRLAAPADGEGRKLVERALSEVATVKGAFLRVDHRSAVRTILDVGQAANQFITQTEPWKLIKSDPERARQVLSDAADVVAILAAMLDPIVPRLAQKLFAQLNIAPLSLKALSTASYPVLKRDQLIGEASPLISRIEDPQVQAILDASKPAATTATPAPAPGHIEYDDFARVALRVGKVLAAEKVPKADKLLKLTVDVGEASPRTICAGIAEAFAPEAVVGKHVVVVANLKPRMLRGIESNGMLLAAGSGKDLLLVDPGNVAPGTEVK